MSASFGNKNKIKNYAEISPLLIEASKEPNKRIKFKSKLFFISLFAILLLIIILILVAYIAQIWPFNSTDSFIVGISGKFPVWGGNIKNQQISLNSKIRKDNVHDIERLCTYISTNEIINKYIMTRYITVDNDNNAYFGTNGGHIHSFNLDSCKNRWNFLVSDIVNYSGPNEFVIYNTITLYKTKTNNNKQSLLFGATDLMSDYNNQCYVVSLNANDGSLIWKTIIAQGDGSSGCRPHGFMIDGKYAFGGISSGSNTLSPSINNLFIGRMFKININNGEIENIWYSFPKYNFTANNYETDGYYTGNGIWPLPSIIDDFVVFGTGNLYNYPRNVEECMLGNIDAVPFENVADYNLCPHDMRENHLNWRCLEKNVYSDSFIVLNKHTFKLESAIPLGGVDAYQYFCNVLLFYGNRTKFYNNPYCPKRELYPNTTYDIITGPDIDPVAIATYHDSSGQAFAAVGQKSGQFYIIEIPNGNIKVIKKVGPWSVDGGSNPFSMAVDEENMIAIYTIIGRSPTDVNIPGTGYSYKMSDGTLICHAGSIYAIDLNTGYTLWEWIHPYSGINEECINSTIDYDEYVDITIPGTCQYSFNGTEMLSPQETVQNVVTPPIDDDVIIPLDAHLRGKLLGPVTINNGMVFISTGTGDIFIHDILTGDYIDRIQCPDYLINQTIWNRAGIRSGISMFDDRIVFFCGTWESGTEYGWGNQIISMKLT